MKKLILSGGRKLNGSVEISGAKNAALPILAASILCDEPIILNNVPLCMEDIRIMLKILEYLGVDNLMTNYSFCMDPTNFNGSEVPAGLGDQIRGSILMLGALLAKCGKCRVPIPGGCKIGERAFDVHIDGLRSLGAKVNVNDGFICAEAARLKGTNMKLRLPSSTGTENILMVACLAEGKTTIENAHTRPEVLDLICFLNKMGAKIVVPAEGIIEIEGVDKLHPCEFSIMGGGDEVITYIAAAGVTQGSILIKNADIKYIEHPVASFRSAGLEIQGKNDEIYVNTPDSIKPFDIITGPYPEINSDMQPFFSVLATQGNGKSSITDTRFLDRFQYVDELRKMGSNIEVNGNTAIVTGKTILKGAEVEAIDLRAGGALVVAGLVADGLTKISNIYQIDRGYEHFEAKLSSLGADIKRIDEDDA